MWCTCMAFLWTYTYNTWNGINRDGKNMPYTFLLCLKLLRSKCKCARIQCAICLRMCKWKFAFPTHSNDFYQQYVGLNWTVENEWMHFLIKCCTVRFKHSLSGSFLLATCREVHYIQHGKEIQKINYQLQLPVFRRGCLSLFAHVHIPRHVVWSIFQKCLFKLLYLVCYHCFPQPLLLHPLKQRLCPLSESLGNLLPNAVMPTYPPKIHNKISSVLNTWYVLKSSVSV